MLDILGSVFGRSKKSTNGSSGSAGTNKDDDFVTIEGSQTLYPTIMLTDQMLKGGDQSLTTNSNGMMSTTVASSTSTSSIQQSSSLLPSPPPLPSMPPNSSSMSNLAQNNNLQSQSSSAPFTQSSSIIGNVHNQRRHHSPLDNVPFTLSSSSSSGRASNGGLPDYDDCFNKIVSIGINLERSQSYYSFTVERTVMNHSWMMITTMMMTMTTTMTTSTQVAKRELIINDLDDKL